MQNIKDKIEITHSNIKSNTRNDEDLPMQTSSENLMETNHRVETSKNIPTQTSSEKFGATQPCITSRKRSTNFVLQKFFSIVFVPTFLDA